MAGLGRKKNPIDAALLFFYFFTKKQQPRRVAEVERTVTLFIYAVGQQNTLEVVRRAAFDLRKGERQRSRRTDLESYIIFTDRSASSFLSSSTLLLQFVSVPPLGDICSRRRGGSSGDSHMSN